MSILTSCRFYTPKDQNYPVDNAPNFDWREGLDWASMDTLVKGKLFDF
jgi:hypothetical protein